MAKKKKIDLYQRPDGLYEKGVTINGKRVRFRGYSEKEILQKIAAYKEKEEKGPLFETVADKWRDQYEKEVEYYTYEKTKAPYERAKTFFAGYYIKNITPQDINRFYNDLSAKGYAKKTINNQRAILSNIFKVALLDGHITNNPVALVNLPRNLPKTKRSLPSDDEIKLVKNSTDCTFGLFAYFLMYTGCRKGEALALQYGDIDLKNKKIRISKAVYFVGNQPQIKQPKTDAGTREIPLLDKLAPYIPKGKKSDYVFSPDGLKPYDDSAFRRQWYAYQKESGVTATPHQLRHAYATMLYEAGIDEKLAQELMGHADISTTKNIYTHIRLSRMEDAANKLNSIDF